MNTEKTIALRVVGRIESGEFPRYLYKYRVLQDHTQPDQLNTFTRDLVTKATLWHPSPKDFNDPFDCRLALDRRKPETLLRMLVKVLGSDEGRAERRRKLSRFRQEPQALLDRFETLIWETMNNIGVCCYGTSGDNILMWSHYGDAHQGVCFKFDVLANPIAYNDLLRVQYSKEYPRIAAVDYHSMTTYLSTKSDIWAYENEWRVFTRTGPGLKAFRKQGLVEVIFGCKAGTAPMKAMADLVTADPELHQVQLRQARVKKSTYGLRLVEYE